MTSPSEATPRRAAARDLDAELPADLAALLVHARAGDGPVRRLAAVGDVGFSGALADLADDPLREVAPFLRRADLVFANLETPLLPAPAGRLFAGPSRTAATLGAAGVGVVSLANNHALDHGAEGLAATRAALAGAGVETVGAGPAPRRLVRFDLDGLAVGLLAAARTHQAQPEDGEGFWEYDPAALAQAIVAARAEVDVLVVSLHLGYMFVDHPHPGQRREILRLLDAGADLVLGHHPHVLQGVEVRAAAGQARIAAYSLGNFLLDWSEGAIPYSGMVEEQRSGAVVLAELDRRGVRRLALLPTRVDDAWTVRWARGEAGRRILERLERLGRFDAAAAAAFHRQLAERVGGHALRSVGAELRQGGPRALLTLLPRLRPHHLRMLGGHLWRRLAGR